MCALEMFCYKTSRIIEVMHRNVMTLGSVDVDFKRIRNEGF